MFKKQLAQLTHEQLLKLCNDEFTYMVDSEQTKEYGIVEMIEEIIKSDTAIEPTVNDSEVGKWVYCELRADSFDSEKFDTKEEAIQHAKQQGYVAFHVGQVSPMGPRLDVETAVENAADEVYNEVGELAEQYLTSVPKEALAELEDNVNDVFQTWLTKYDLHPKFYFVKDIENISVTPPPKPEASPPRISN